MRRQLIYSAVGNRSAIAFFAGWAMDQAPFSHLCKSGYDIYIFYDYRSVEPELYTSLFSLYDKVAVVAWSFGVAVVNTLISQREETRIAVNGTAQGVDNRCGLPKPYNNLTLRHLSPETLDTFYHKVFPDDLFDLLFANRPSRDLGELAQELKVIGDTEFLPPSPFWDKVYVGGKDFIIPPENQLRSWADHNPVFIADGAHGVDFQHIIDTDIVNKAVVAQRFTRKAESYETHAGVQRDMAARLMEMLRANKITLGGKRVLEVGIGTGFLTRLYSSEAMESAEAVDIADRETLVRILRDAGCHFPGTVITADAEEYIANKSDCYDVILSASTIQWFNSQRQFIANCARALRKGGILAIATFAPGTYQEISSITRSSLTYYPIDWYVNAVKGMFEPVDCREESITISFPDPHKLMEHISLTGVNAVSQQQSTVSHTISLMRRLPRNPNLTYNSIYLIFRKL